MSFAMMKCTCTMSLLLYNKPSIDGIVCVSDLLVFSSISQWVEDLCILTFYILCIHMHEFVLCNAQFSLFSLFSQSVICSDNIMNKMLCKYFRI